MSESVQRPLILSLICAFYVFIGVVALILLALVLYLAISGTLDRDLIYLIVSLTVYGVLFTFGGIWGWKGKPFSWHILIAGAAMVILVNAYYYDSGQGAARGQFMLLLVILYLLLSTKAKAYLRG